MTIGEIKRYAEAWEYRERAKQKQKAVLDYTHANHLASLIGMVLSGKGEQPDFEDVYEFLLTKEEIEKHKQQKSINAFISFAKSFNTKYNDKQGGE